MSVTLFLASALLLQGQVEPIELTVLRKPGEKLAYAVRSHLLSEVRGGIVTTWFPDELDLNYDFTMEIGQSKGDGVVDLRYRRPKITQIAGETASEPPKTTVDQVNLDLLVTVSPINEVLAMKNNTAQPTPKKSGESQMSHFEPLPSSRWTSPPQALIDQFIGEVYRLALYTGSLDAALDFAPRLPVDAVSPGDTWQRTVGYSPQKLRGKGNKTAVQRLDYTYTYRGIMDVGGKKVYRVDADLNLDTNLADFFHQVSGMTPSQSGLQSLPLKLKSKIEFDLDFATRRTLKASASSEGGYSIHNTQFQGAAREEKLKGRTTMKLLSVK